MRIKAGMFFAKLGNAFKGFAPPSDCRLVKAATTTRTAKAMLVGSIQSTMLRAGWFAANVKRLDSIIILGMNHCAAVLYQLVEAVT